MGFGYRASATQGSTAASNNFRTVYFGGGGALWEGKRPGVAVYGGAVGRAAGFVGVGVCASSDGWQVAGKGLKLL